MTTEVRDFKDFRKFPGKVIDNVYTFPTLWTKNVKGTPLFWNMYVALLPAKKYNFAHNWDRNSLKFLPIEDEYYNSKQTPALSSIVAITFTERGQENGVRARRPATIINTGAKGLIGKANERNVFTQALINARSEYEKCISKGYSTSKNSDKSNSLYYAMAAHSYKDKEDKVAYPCYSQPKLDGVRCITCMKDGVILRYSRDHNSWPGYESFDKYLMPIFKEHPDLHFDGELYLHGKRLQEITGTARNLVKSFNLEYHVFDVFYGNNLNMPFYERLACLSTLANAHTIPPESGIKLVETREINNREELDTAYRDYIAHHYEGQMIRNRDGKYETSKFGEIRSNMLLKRKKLFDAEYKLVRAEAATKGRAVGTFIGVFVNAIGKEFNAVFKGMTMEEQRNLYNQYVADPKSFIGQLYTIDYEDLSEDQVPLRPKIKAIRN